MIIQDTVNVVNRLDVLTPNSRGVTRGEGNNPRAVPYRAFKMERVDIFVMSVKILLSKNNSPDKKNMYAPG